MGLVKNPYKGEILKKISKNALKIRIARNLEIISKFAIKIFFKNS